MRKIRCPTEAVNSRSCWTSALRTVIACRRSCIGVTFGAVTDRMGLVRHGAHSFGSLLTRTAATIAAHTLLRVHRADLGVA